MEREKNDKANEAEWKQLVSPSKGYIVATFL